MLGKRKKIKCIIAFILSVTLIVTVFAPVASAEEAEPTIPDLSETLCVTIDEFSPNTKVSTLISNTVLSETESFEVYDKEGFLLSSSDFVPNGAVVIIRNNGTVTEAYKVRLYGDLDCDGIINSFDLAEIRYYLAGSPIDEIIAADLNADSIVNTSDLSVMKMCNAGVDEIIRARQYAFASRFNWLNTSEVDFEINGYQEVFEDFSVVSNDIDLTFNRYYDSQNTASGILGDGWTASFEGSCKTYGETSKVVSIYGQTPIVFEYLDAEYSCEYSRASLTCANNGYVYIGEDRLTYTFNSNGYLISIADTNGNTVSIEVDSQGKIQKVTDSVNREYTYAYNSNGYLSKITDPAGRTVNYSYSVSGRLSSVTGVLGTVTQRYSYNTIGKLTTVSDDFNNAVTQITYEENSGVVTSITDADSVIFNYLYNPAFNSITVMQNGEVVEQYVYNRYNYLSVHTSDEGVQINHFLNAFGDTVLTENADGSNTEYTYDSKGNALKIVTTSEEETSTETNTYDSSGNLLTTTSDGEKYTYTYDGNGNVLTVSKEEDGEVTETSAYTYNEKGLVITSQIDAEIVSYTYNSYGYVTSEAVTNGLTTNYTYDIIGNVLTEATEEKTVTYIYNFSGDVLRKKENNTVKERTVYDNYGRIVQQISEAEYTDNHDGLNTASKTDTYSNNGNEVDVGVRYYYSTDGKLCEIKASCYTVYTDSAQKVTSVKAGNTVLASYNYTNDAKELLSNINYANGQSISYTYDTEGNITALGYGNITAYTYAYDTEGTLTSKTNLISGIRTVYTDDNVTVSRINEDNTLTEIYSYTTEQLTDDTEVDYERITENFNNNSFSADYYEDYFKYNSFTHTTNLNDYEAVSSIQINNGSSSILNSAYTYNEDDLPTGLVNTYGSTNDNYSYTYDGNGNITSVIRNNKNRRYHYDNAGQLIRVDDELAGNTVVYEYNGVSGNIKSIKYYAYTTADTVSSAILSQKSFSYNDSNWSDLLTSVDGNALTYDALGNVLSYNGYTYTWTAGRHLSEMTNGTNTFSYKYDDNGIRTEKTVNGVTTHYTTVDGRITGQYDGTNTIYFRYNAENSLVGFNLNGTEYIYIKNIQGDIEGILDQNGNLVVQYTYDAWGKVLSTIGALADTVGAINPMRYRDYYLDSETGYYYLQSRYYNPDICRFINADEPVYIGASSSATPICNSFAYCINNPINSLDITGHYTGTLVLSATYISLLSKALSGLIASIMSSITAIKAAVATSWIPAVCIAAAAVAVAGITYAVIKVNHLSKSASKTISAVKSKIKDSGEDSLKLKSYTVYVITKKGTTDVVYVGITKRYNTRKSQHKKRFPTNKYTMMPIATNLTKSQARALEQTLITAYGIDTLKNMINSISPKKWNNFKSEFSQMQTLIQSWKDPE